MGFCENWIIDFFCPKKFGKKGPITCDRQIFDRFPNVNLVAAIPDRRDGEEGYLLEIGFHRKPKAKPCIKFQDEGQQGFQNNVIYSELGRIETINTATMEAEAVSADSISAAQNCSPHTLKKRGSEHFPAMGGFSIGRAHSDRSGTLGCKVTVTGGEAGDYFLTCWHVAGGTRARVGDLIFQPGRNDSYFGSYRECLEQTYFGTLAGWINDDEHDISLVKVPANHRFAPGIMGLSVKQGIVQEKTDAVVKKCGRTTCITEGKIASFQASVRVTCFPSEAEKVFTNQILTTACAEPGDSGSFLVQKQGETWMPTGLIFAKTEKRNIIDFEKHDLSDSVETSYTCANSLYTLQGKLFEPDLEITISENFLSLEDLESLENSAG